MPSENRLWGQLEDLWESGRSWRRESGPDRTSRRQFFAGFQISCWCYLEVFVRKFRVPFASGRSWVYLSLTEMIWTVLRIYWVW